MKYWFFLISLFAFSSIDSQVKTLIPIEEEVNLPVDSNHKIYMTTTFEESQIKTDTLVPFFLKEIKRNMNSSAFYVIDSGENFIELFVVYPCKSFNLYNIQNHEIINEGIITSTLLIEFREHEYEISVKDFDWVNRHKNKFDMNKLYLNYIRTKDLKEKIKYYGILKSAELSISETYSYLTVIVEEIIKKKSLIQEKL